MTTTNQIVAGRHLNRMGYYLTDGQLRYVTDTGSRFVCDLQGDVEETLHDLEVAGWPTYAGEIPCSECGDHQNQLGGLCNRCAANYHNVE